MWTKANEETWHEPEEYHGEGEYEEHYDEHGHIARQDEPEQSTEWDYVEDDDTAVALVAMAECDHHEAPADGFDDLAEAAQQLYAGYMAAGTQKGKTKGFKCKDKGKSKGKHIFRTQLSVQDRAKRLAELKKLVPNASNVEAPAIGQVILLANFPGIQAWCWISFAISDEESSAGEYGVLHVRSRQEKEHAAFPFSRWISRLGWFQHGQWQP